MRSLRARVAIAAIAATAVAFVLLVAAVIGTFALDMRREPLHMQPPPVGAFDENRPFMGPENRDGPPRQIKALARRMTFVSLLVLGLVGAAGLALGGVALRPLASLRRAAERVASTRDLATRLPQGEGPEEVDALAGSLNAMLERLQRSTSETEAALEASRRFAADAGHELRTPLTSMQANLDVLARTPDLPAMERQRVLRDVAREQARVVALLDALQTLARGDAAAAVPRQPFDLADVVDAEVSSARVRHPQTSIHFADPGEVPMVGWPDGLRVLVDNLLENAVRHGRPDGRTEVSLDAANGQVRLIVDDDGPGVPPAERTVVFERFARGSATRADGSGLGLALVAQQAVLHGGDATITDAPAGGARVVVTLWRQPPDGKQHEGSTSNGHEPA